MLINQRKRPYVAPMFEKIGVDMQMQVASISITDPVEKSLDDPDEEEGDFVLFPRRIVSNKNVSCKHVFLHDNSGTIPF